MMFTMSQLLDLSHSAAGAYLCGFAYPWQALDGIHALIIKLGSELGEDYTQVSPQVWVHRSAVIAPTAYLGSPCIIGPETEVRHCAFIRGSALIGRGCVIGNSTEIKNAILFDQVQVPHFNYVGDSILGYCAHMGAGAVTSNVKSDKSPVRTALEGQSYETGRVKFGAVLADHVEVGCNCVLNPGTIVGRCTSIYPTSCVRGFVPADSIFKCSGQIIRKI